MTHVFMVNACNSRVRSDFPGVYHEGRQACSVQSCKSGRAFRVGFEHEIDKLSGLIRARHTYLPSFLAYRCYESAIKIPLQFSMAILFKHHPIVATQVSLLRHN